MLHQFPLVVGGIDPSWPGDGVLVKQNRKKWRNQGLFWGVACVRCRRTEMRERVVTADTVPPIGIQFAVRSFDAPTWTKRHRGLLHGNQSDNAQNQSPS